MGIDHLAKRFAEISIAHDGRGLVLLCYEFVDEICHRQVLARWLGQQTGTRSRNYRMVGRSACFES